LCWAFVFFSSFQCDWSFAETETLCTLV
jgi:hypothetical protein